MEFLAAGNQTEQFGNHGFKDSFVPAPDLKCPALTTLEMGESVLQQALQY